MRLSKLPVVLLAIGISLCSKFVIAQTFDDIGNHYANLAEAVFTDSLTLAKVLDEDIEAFLETPSEWSLETAKKSWIEARKVYGISEVFRFSHPVVDDWEPQVNAWPLDEGLIDYVDGDSYYYELGNPVGKANIVANSSLSFGSSELDLEDLTPDLLASLNEIGGTEANVATGWHAIEFLLWGQDLNGTGPGAGQRSHTDFLIGDECTNNNCDRRREYLDAASNLLITDLEFIVAEWSEGENNYRSIFDTMPGEERIRRILYGIGSLALGELAGERMKVALFANSPEDEHDCFSDSTHNTLYANASGILMALNGEYQSVSGEQLSGPSLLGWAEENTSNSMALEQSASAVSERLTAIVLAAENGEAFDQMIAPGNKPGADRINKAIDSLVDYTREIELLAAEMELGTLSPDNAGHDF